jgi:hypothetical protein
LDYWKQILDWDNFSSTTSWLCFQNWIVHAHAAAVSSTQEKWRPPGRYDHRGASTSLWCHSPTFNSMICSLRLGLVLVLSVSCWSLKLVLSLLCNTILVELYQFKAGYSNAFYLTKGLSSEAMLLDYVLAWSIHQVIDYVISSYPWGDMVSHVALHPLPHGGLGSAVSQLECVCILLFLFTPLWMITIPRFSAILQKQTGSCKNSRY